MAYVLTSLVPYIAYRSVHRSAYDLHKRKKFRGDVHGGLAADVITTAGNQRNATAPTICHVPSYYTCVPMLLISGIPAALQAA
ncbi:hypothetical protein [Mesobacillus zeae]|uniref:hypothetical protein n=1 Tax=Mesobacillus zeae TaxID=1917180 RepID=UPI003008BC6C